MCTHNADKILVEYQEDSRSESQIWRVLFRDPFRDRVKEQLLESMFLLDNDEQQIVPSLTILASALTGNTPQSLTLKCFLAVCPKPWWKGFQTDVVAKWPALIFEMGKVMIVTSTDTNQCPIMDLLQIASICLPQADYYLVGTVDSCVEWSQVRSRLKKGHFWRADLLTKLQSFCFCWEIGLITLARRRTWPLWPYEVEELVLK